MPELPEVETVRADLERLVTGATITRAEILCEPMLLGAAVADTRLALEGATITQVARHGKALILRLSSGHSLVIHFRMTGRLYPLPPGAPLPAHTRSVLHLADGRRLIHQDTRRLGTLELVPSTSENRASTLENLGPDALRSPLLPGALAALLSRRSCSIKAFLLDQRAMAGVGNIYASEVLWRARIAPHTPCAALTPEQARAMMRQVKRVLRDAVQARGTTISDYRTGTGAEGGFQARLAVYGREGRPCLRRGCRGTVLRTVIGQRSTFHCPECQAGDPVPASPAR